jgi:predicted transcriptional regulator
MAFEAQHGADPEHLLAVLAALDNPHRIRLIALLARKRSYISELARDIGLSRPLLYLHLGKLQAAGLVRGSLELSDSGRAKKWFELVPFEIRLTPDLVIAAADYIAAAHDPHGPHSGQRNETGGEQT